jgi:hypothetical protein
MGGMAMSLPFFLCDGDTGLIRNKELNHSPRLIFFTKNPSDIHRKNDLRLGNAVTTILTASLQGTAFCPWERPFDLVDQAVS